MLWAAFDCRIAPDTRCDHESRSESVIKINIAIKRDDSVSWGLREAKQMEKSSLLLVIVGVPEESFSNFLLLWERGLVSKGYGTYFLTLKFLTF